MVIAKHKLELGPVYIVEDLTGNCGINPSLINHDIPVMWDRVYNYVFLVANNVDNLHKIEPDMKHMAKFCAKDKFDICIIAKGKDNIIHARCFAPVCGIDEDAATGSAMLGLFTYAVKQGLIVTNDIIVKQGEAMERTSTLYVSKIDDSSVKVSGQVVHLYQIELKL